MYSKRAEQVRTAIHNHVTRSDQLHRLELADADKAPAALPPVQSATFPLIGLDGTTMPIRRRLPAPRGCGSTWSRARSALTAMVRLIPEDRAAALVAYGTVFSPQPCRANV
jgi:hypothetical protein